MTMESRDVDITATVVVTPQDQCDPINGTIDVTTLFIDGVNVVTGLSRNFSEFKIRVFNDADTTAGGAFVGAFDVSTNNPPALTGLSAGNYFVYVIDRSTDCISDAIQAEILDNTVLPTVDVGITAFDTDCSGTGPNGELTASVVGGVVTDFTWEWYVGTDTTDATGTLAANFTDNVANDLSGGQLYSVVAINNTSGCRGLATMTMESRDVDITATVVVTPQDQCDPINGTIDVTTLFIDGQDVVGTLGRAFSEFKIRVFNDADTTAGGAFVGAFDVSTNNPPALTGISAGNYFVYVIDRSTNCISDAIQAEILDNTVLPTVDVSITAFDTDCSGVNPNGELTAGVVGGLVTDFTWEWYVGADTTDATGTLVANFTDNVANDLSDGQLYSVVAVNNTSGCRGLATITMESRDVTINLTASVLRNHTECDLSVGNGEIEVTGVTIDGVPVADLTTVSIDWYDDFADIATSTVFFNGESKNDLLPDTYYIIVTDSRSCTSSALELTVEQETTDPVVVFTIIQEDTFCSVGGPGTSGDGILEVGVQETIGGPLVTTNYTIEWFRGTTTGLALDGNGTAVVTGTDDERAENLSEGFYTVRITDTSSPDSDCQTIATFELTESPDEITITQADVSIADNTNCTDAFNPFTGSIKVDNVREGGTQVAVTNYTFVWASAGGGALPAGATTFNVDGVADSLANLPAGTYEVLATNNTTQCVTAIAIQIGVGEELTDPTLSFVMTPNTICDPLLPAYPNGTVTATAQFMGSGFEGMGRFSFEWFDGNSTGAASLGAGAAGATDNITVLSNEEPGFYTLEVTDQVTGCTFSSTVSIDEVLDIPALANPEANVTGSTICVGAGNGTITINDADVSGGDLGLYRVDWIQGAPTNLPFSSDMNPAATSVSRTGLDPDLYYVVVTNTATGCGSVPALFEVQDESFNPTMTFTLTSNTVCTGTGNGRIEVTPSDPSDPAPVFTFLWTGLGGDPEETSSILTNRTEGIYEVTVTNTNTNCSVTQQIELEREDILPSITMFTIDNNQTTCNANGQATVTEVTYNGAVDLVANYTIEWFDDSGEQYRDDGTGTFVFDNAAPGPAYNLPTITGIPAGTYNVQVVGTDVTTNNGCTSGQFQFTIEDDISLPVLSFTEVQPDTSCDGINGTGAIQAFSDGLTEIDDANLDFTWHQGSSTLDPVIGVAGQSLLENVLAGTYTVAIIDNNTGCTASASFILSNQPFEPFITDIDVTATTSCAPGNGSAEITAVASGNVNEYDYFWFATEAQIASFTSIHTGTSFTGLQEGSYFVIAEHIDTGCRTLLPQQVNVLDSTIAPVITLVDASTQTNCNPAIPNGVIAAAADGVSDTGLFRYIWRNSNGVVIEPNNHTVTGLAAGQYTLEVESLSNGCTNQRTFTMIDENDPPFLNLTPFDVTYCVNPTVGVMPNGAVSANIITPDDPNDVNSSAPMFDIYWFRGTTVPGNFADFTTDPNFIEVSTFIDTLSAGPYTAIAVNQADNFCTSQPQTVIVEDNSMMPDLVITQETALTNCDPLRPNAEASVSTPGNSIANFIIEWYAGADTTGIQPFLSGFGQIFADSLSAITYTVVITDAVQGCQTLEQITIEDQTEPVPIPEFDVIVNRTNCVDPDGAATVTIEGDLRDFMFEWFAEDDLDTPLFTGTSGSGLDAGNYVVTAENLITGCVSDQALLTIVDESGPIPFIVETTPSVCSLDNGTATLRFDRPITIDSIAWDLGGGDIRFDITLVNATDGQNYTVFVRDENQCESSATFAITTDIIVYNGVSDNSDGFNDFFIIDCIDRFEFNSVTIFNRAGQPVWETGDAGYVNGDPDNSFSGFGNKGVSLGTDRLPEGTYYYVIDRNRLTDNDDILQGFLELVR